MKKFIARGEQQIGDPLSMALLKVKYCSTNRRNFIENRMFYHFKLDEI